MLTGDQGDKSQVTWNVTNEDSYIIRIPLGDDLPKSRKRQKGKQMLAFCDKFSISSTK